MGGVTSSDVKEIVQTPADLEIEPFINMASVLVAQLRSEDTDNKLTDDALYNIELNLAAHFTSMRVRQFKSRTTDNASGVFMGMDGKDLDATLYGQTAKMLDCTGYLETVGKRKKHQAGALFLGIRDPDSYPEVPDNVR